jgi:PAS domain S-box-containing protein
MVLIPALAWAVAVGLTVAFSHPAVALGLGVIGLGSTVLTLLVWRLTERRRWVEPVHVLAEHLAATTDRPGRTLDPPERPELVELVEAIDQFHDRLKADALARAAAKAQEARLTRSGMFEAPSTEIDLTSTGDYSTLDMVNRLEPKSLRWLESSPAEQDFLGWSLQELRKKSFLDIIHPDDRNLAFEQLHGALVKGEAHGLIYRIKTAKGQPKAIEVNVGVRYGPDMTATHLRCHVTDVTAKVRASRELKRRTRELTLLNEQLRKTNRELQELKDRYSDLYQNAPAMYFSLDGQAYLIDCNNTMLRTLGYQRHELIGRPFTALLPDAQRPQFAAQFAEFLRLGHIELEGRWKKANGDLINVWVTGSAVKTAEGTVRQMRGVAMDVTARRALEAELHIKNERLARTNTELARRNKELDEFTYVVSHDLQEPLRTLIAFSDFLLRDYGDRLDVTGQEYVRYLVEASRRMRALISDLLTLSRAGRVTGDRALVNLDEVIGLVKADLAELIRAKGAEIRVQSPLPTLWVDRDRIVQLFGNLVSNGIKYNQNSPPIIEIGAEPANDPRWATLFVRDNGIGIEPQFHTKIFQIFRRLHPRDVYEGTGAGLAICQKIVQAHGGRIGVQSQPGQGSTFLVTLPKTPPDVSPLRTELLHAP